MQFVFSLKQTGLHEQVYLAMSLFQCRYHLSVYKHFRGEIVTFLSRDNDYKRVHISNTPYVLLNSNNRCRQRGLRSVVRPRLSHSLSQFKPAFNENKKKTTKKMFVIFASFHMHACRAQRPSTFQPSTLRFFFLITHILH